MFLDKVLISVNPDKKLHLVQDNLLYPLTKPPIFPRSWSDSFEAEFSHNDQEICQPAGSCSERLKQIFPYKGSSYEDSYCPFCAKLFQVNVYNLRLIFGAKFQDKVDYIIESLL